MCYSTQGFHVFQRIHPWGENEKHRGGGTTFSEGLGKFSLSALCILHPELLFHKVSTGRVEKKDVKITNTTPDMELKDNSQQYFRA